MSNTNTGGTAFPCDLTAYDPEVQREMQGMTLRDYFAAKALWGVLNENHMTQKQMAKWSYEVADEMLRAREAT